MTQHAERFSGIEKGDKKKQERIEVKKAKRHLIIGSIIATIIIAFFVYRSYEAKKWLEETSNSGQSKPNYTYKAEKLDLSEVPPEISNAFSKKYNEEWINSDGSQWQKEEIKEVLDRTQLFLFYLKQKRWDDLKRKTVYIDSESHSQQLLFERIVKSNAEIDEVKKVVVSSEYAGDLTIHLKNNHTINLSLHALRFKPISPYKEEHYYISKFEYY